MTTTNDNNKPQVCMHPRCADCRFYDEQHDNPDYDHMEVGYCRRHAPRPFTVECRLSDVEDLNWGYFPLVLAKDVCGEFEHKAEAADGVLPWQKARMRTKAPQNAQHRVLCQKR